MSWFVVILHQRHWPRSIIICTGCRHLFFKKKNNNNFVISPICTRYRFKADQNNILKWWVFKIHTTSKLLFLQKPCSNSIKLIRSGLYDQSKGSRPVRCFLEMFVKCNVKMIFAFHSVFVVFLFCVFILLYYKSHYVLHVYFLLKVQHRDAIKAMLKHRIVWRVRSPTLHFVKVP